LNQGFLKKPAAQNKAARRGAKAPEFSSFRLQAVFCEQKATLYAKLRNLTRPNKKAHRTRGAFFFLRNPESAKRCVDIQATLACLLSVTQSAYSRSPR
jgi:hypothetical protein